MPNLDWLLSFAEITFPIFLLVPSLVGGLGKHISPIELVRFYLVLLVQYLIIGLALAYGLGAEGDWQTFGLLIVSAVLVSVGLWYVMRWTLFRHFAIYTGLAGRLET